MRLILLLSVCLLSACSSVPIQEPINVVEQKQTIAEDELLVAEQSQSEPVMTEDELLFYLLRKEFFNWEGTPYRFGGNNKKGVDCSALVQNIYYDSLNIKLPRTTYTQVKKGFLVYKNQLQIGDLVFFKTGRRTRHVGIYMGDNQFIHASVSKGVITSSLNNVYWKRKYWQSRRILE